MIKNDETFNIIFIHDYSRYIRTVKIKIKYTIVPKWYVSNSKFRLLNMAKCRSLNESANNRYQITRV